MITRYVGQARDTVTTAGTEARLRHDAMLGVEHLTVALMHDPTISTSCLGGRRAEDGRRALETMDAAALRSAGVELPPIPPSPASDPSARLMLSAGARQALDQAGRIARQRRSRTVENRDLLQAVLSAPAPNPAHQLLRALGLDPAEVLTALTF